MKKYAWVPVLALFPVLMSCATLEVSKVPPDTPKVKDLSGFPYMLQFTQYKIALTRRVLACGSEMKFSTNADITPEVVDDGDHVYVIKADSLISPMKISDLKLEWSNGRLVSINASADDRTAQVVMGVVQGLGQIAKTLVGAQVVGRDGNMPERCNDETLAALDQQKASKRKIDELDGQVQEASSELARVKAALILAGEDKKLRQQAVAQVKIIDAANVQLAQEKKTLERAVDFLSYKETFRWPERSSDELLEGPRKVAPSLFEKWYLVEDKELREKRYQAFADSLNVWLAIERVGSYGRVRGEKPDDDSGSASDGLRFRVPARGKLMVCKSQDCTASSPGNIVAVSEGPILQLGRIFYAPFSSPAFASGSFEMTFDELGRPKKAGVARKNSSAEAIATLAKDLGTEASSLFDAMHKTDAEKAAAELAALDSQKKIADARAALDPNSSASLLAALEMDKKLADARAALEPSPTRELARLTAIAEAQKKYNDALQSLAPLPENEAQRQAYEANAALLKAEAASIEAEIQLRDARRRRLAAP